MLVLYESLYFGKSGSPKASCIDTVSAHFCVNNKGPKKHTSKFLFSY